jgi:outer membrane lipoprotein SlyB
MGAKARRPPFFAADRRTGHARWRRSRRKPARPAKQAREPDSMFGGERTACAPPRTLAWIAGNLRRCRPSPKEHIIKTTQKLVAGLIAAMPLLSITLVAAPAQAQQYYNAGQSERPRIRGFNVDEVRRLTPGVELNFDLYGTPGGRATLHIDGANRNLNLTETEPGQYEGTYTIGGRDRITGASAVTANLRVGNQITSGVLAESLLRADRGQWRGRRGDLAQMPRIERFDVQGNDDLGAGNELTFSVYGTPGAKVDMTISGTRGVFFLPEVSAGTYSGAYTIRRSDRIVSNSVVTANMRVDGRVSSATLGKPLLIAAVPASTPRVVRYCSNCATVEAVNVIEVNGDGNYLGTVGGGVLGALLGSQVGGGSGRTAAEVAGAVGGAYVGRNIQRNSNRSQHYEVVIRFLSGGTQSLTFDNDPGFRVGEKVKVNNGVLARDQ